MKILVEEKCRLEETLSSLFGLKKWKEGEKKNFVKKRKRQKKQRKRRKKKAELKETLVLFFFSEGGKNLVIVRVAKRKEKRTWETSSERLNPSHSLSNNVF